jgi:hypothetical protein
MRSHGPGGRGRQRGAARGREGLQCAIRRESLVATGGCKGPKRVMGGVEGHEKRGATRGQEGPQEIVGGHKWPQGRRV